MAEPQIKAKIILDTSELDRFIGGGGSGGSGGSPSQPSQPSENPNDPNSSTGLLKDIASNIFQLVRISQGQLNLSQAGKIGAGIDKLIGTAVGTAVTSALLLALGGGALAGGAIATGKGLVDQFRNEGEEGTGMKDTFSVGGFDSDLENARANLGLTQEEAFQQGIERPSETISAGYESIEDAIIKQVETSEITAKLMDEIFGDISAQARLYKELNNAINERTRVEKEAARISSGSLSIFGTSNRRSPVSAPFTQDVATSQLEEERRGTPGTSEFELNLALPTQKFRGSISDSNP